MCGVVGALDTKGRGRVALPSLRRMLGALRHRGPDQFGIYMGSASSADVGLGSARLSIVDLKGGVQPMTNEDDSLWIVFNGEIYNHPELRADLENLGYRFRTRSDTEVVLRMFEAHDAACLSRLNGQFAFAIWNARSGRLFIARDRCGVRPLFYTDAAGVLVFASEIKALLCYPGVTAALDPKGLGESFVYWAPLSPSTVFECVRSLPPGCWMDVEPDGEARVVRYWQASFPIAGAEAPINEHEAADRLSALLRDAVALRLRSDVPVGAYVSGGLDSTLIARMIQEVGSSDLRTFSVSFTDPEYDEGEYQRRLTGLLGTRHRQIHCEPADIGQVFPDVVWHTETPLLRTAPAPMYLLSRLVRDEGLKVVLTGEGADEVLGGYDLFKEAKIRSFWARQPQSKMRPMLLERIYPEIAGLSAIGLAYKKAFFGQRLADVDRPTYSHDLRWTTSARLLGLLAPEVLDRWTSERGDTQCAKDLTPFAPEGRSLPERFMEWSPLSRAQYIEIVTFMSEYLLSSQGDRVAMAHSVEGRFPFLDPRLIEFASTLSPDLKLRGLREKYVLRAVAADHLPRDLASRRKRPYRAPIAACFFRSGKPLEWVAQLTTPQAIRRASWLNADAVRMLLQKAADRPALGEVDSMGLVGVLSTQLLHNRFFEDFQPPPPVTEGELIRLVMAQTPDRSAGAASSSDRCPRDGKQADGRKGGQRT